MISVRMPGMNNNFWLLVAVLEPVFFLVPNSFLARVAKGNTRLITLMSKPIVLFLFYFSLDLFVGLFW